MIVLLRWVSGASLLCVIIHNSTPILFILLLLVHHHPDSPEASKATPCCVCDGLTGNKNHTHASGL